MTVVVLEPDSAFDIAALGRPRILSGPLGELPQLDRRQVHFERSLRRLLAFGNATDSLSDLLGFPITFGSPEFLWRPSGIKRPNLVAQLISSQFASRVGLGVEISLAHAIVDRMLGFERLEAERRLQLTPVEWGIWTFLLAQWLSRSEYEDLPTMLRTFALDRVGPDAFDLRGLGSVVTVRWPLTVGAVEGSVRLWLPEGVAARVLDQWAPPLPEATRLGNRLSELAGVWRGSRDHRDAPRPRRLRVGGVLPLRERPFAGTPRDPKGTLHLILETTRDGRFWFLADPVPNTGAGHVVVSSPLQITPAPREALSVSSSPSPAPPQNAGISPSDVPVTLVVELGRVNLSISRLADLKPGDVVELGRHSREPVELTSGGRLVARGELVQIDTELGIRITSVFM